MMSNTAMMGSTKSKEIPVPPPPPPPPPPLKRSSKESELTVKTKSGGAVRTLNESEPKLQTKSSARTAKDSKSNKNSSQQRSKNASSKSSATTQKSKSKSQKSSKQTMGASSASYAPEEEYISSSNITLGDEAIKSEDLVSQRPQKSASRRTKAESVVEIVRNDVPFFNEEECTDPEDDYSFPCCLQPNSPRFPPNPRPYREWDPSYLPSSTNVPTSIGGNCRRCGKPVYLAELYLSSRGAYHSECYKCCLCGKSLDSWSVAEYKGEVFCKGCYRRNFGTHGCGFGVGAGVLQTP